MVAEVVMVHTVQHLGAAGCSRDRRQQAMQLALAGIAAINRIAGVGRIRQFRRGHLPLADPQPARLLPRLAAQVGRQGRRHPGDRLRPLPQHRHGQGRHQGAVHPAGVGHHHPRPARQGLEHLRQGPLQRCRQGLEQGLGPEGPAERRSRGSRVVAAVDGQIQRRVAHGRQGGSGRRGVDPGKAG